MDNVLHAVNSVLAQVLGDDLVVCQGNTAFVDLAKATLVDQLLGCLQRRETVCHERLHGLEHVQNWLVHLQEHAVVQLAQAQKLQDLARLGCHLDDTNDMNDKQELGLRLNEEIACALCLPAQSNELLGVLRVLFVILQGPHLQVMTLSSPQFLLLFCCFPLLFGQGRVPLHLQLLDLRNLCALGEILSRNEVSLCHCFTSNVPHSCHSLSEP